MLGRDARMSVGPHVALLERIEAERAAEALWSQSYIPDSVHLDPTSGIAGDDCRGRRRLPVGCSLMERVRLHTQSEGYRELSHHHISPEEAERASRHRHHEASSRLEERIFFEEDLEEEDGLNKGGRERGHSRCRSPARQRRDTFQEKALVLESESSILESSTATIRASMSGKKEILSG